MLDAKGFGRSQALPPELENGIANCLITRSNMDLPCDKKVTRISWKVCGRKRKELKTPFKNGVPGQDWYQAFMKRHPTLSRKKPEHLQKLRKNARKLDVIKYFFEELKNVVAKYNLNLKEKCLFIFN